MKRILYLLVVLLLGLPVFVAGCAGSNQVSVKDGAGAREAAIGYLHEKYTDNIPEKNLLWQEADNTPTGLLGSAVKEYTAEDWTMLISYPVVKPESTIYTVMLVNNHSGWKWEGKVDAKGKVEETSSLKQITEEESRQTAEKFVKNSATYIFDGISDTFTYTNTTVLKMPFAWQFTFKFECRHGGYGDRTGQMLEQAITPHTAVVTVIRAQVVSATMDDQWDMIEQHLVNEVEIKTAPIHEVTFNFMESFPVQVGVYVKGGLSDGCTTFHDAVVTREGDTIHITVTVQRPVGMTCTAIYGYFEKNLNLGSDFISGKTYDVKVNDFASSFVYP